MVRHWQCHPPEGFIVASSPHDVPGFLTRFDMLTTAEHGVRDKVQSLPGYRWWRRWLSPRTRFFGSTVTEYTWLPRTPEPERLAADLAREHGRECPLLIIKDIPQASPLLDQADNARVERFVAACRANGFVALEGQALAWVPIDFEDEDDYLSRLSRGARRDIRRKLRTRAVLQVRALPTGDPSWTPALLQRCVELYENVYAQSEVHFDHLSAAFLRALLTEAGGDGMVFIYMHDSEVIGWNLCYVHEQDLVDKYVGFDYPKARELNLYAVSWMHNLAWARQRGLKRYIAGWTDPEVKTHLGARITFTRHLVRPRHVLLRQALRRLAPYFESDRRWYEEQQAHATDRS
ncbi:GNAT family N-acetyltransferase [Oleiagrimonas sp. C23AA]|nr:GNAT family N-acetyltransferase [Oleiagrimonas sp. C23AA]